MKKQIQWLDIFKGIGIFFVVLGHAPISMELKGYIFSFHVPIFFFVSGYLFTIKKYPNFFGYLKKKFKTIILPYIYFSIISAALFAGFQYYGENKLSIDLKNLALEFIFARRNNITYNIALWFLPVLFTVSIMFYLLKKLLRDDVLVLTITLILSAIGFLYFKTLSEPKLFWTFDSSLYYLVFFALGYLAKERKFAESFQKNISRYLFFAIIFVLNLSLLFYAQFYGSVVSYIYSIFAAFLGIFSFAFIAKYVLEKIDYGIFEFLGRNSLTIFILHLPLCFPLVDKIIVKFGLKFANTNWLGLFYTICALVILAPVVLLINNFMPFLKGK